MQSVTEYEDTTIVLKVSFKLAYSVLFQGGFSSASLENKYASWVKGSGNLSLQLSDTQDAGCGSEDANLKLFS